MGILSGTYSSVNGFTSTKSWRLDQKAETKPYVASNTKAGTGRTIGNTDWSGSVGFFGAFPPGGAGIFPSLPFTFRGYIGSPTGVACPYYDGPALCEAISVQWDWMGGNPTTGELRFGANGVLTESAGIPFTDLSNPAAGIRSPIGLQCLVATHASLTYVPLCAARASLNITAANKTYADACTAGQLARVPGPIDWTATITVHETDIDSLPFGLNNNIKLRLPATSAPSYWDLKWGRVSGFNNFNVDRESGDIISFDIQLEMAGFDDTALGDPASVGAIVEPGGTTVWPF